MARQRKSVTVKTVTTEPSNGSRNETNSSSSAGSGTPVRPSTSGGGGGGAGASGERRTLSISMSKYRIAFGCCCLAIASCFGYVGYLETRVNTPFDDQKMVQRTGLEYPDRYWGTYRPGLYFGMKTRDPHSPVMGLMWYSAQRLGPGGTGIRHWCDSGDNLAKYGWLQHDGRTFGVQEIVDGPFDIETSFVKFPGGKFGGDWTARVTVKSNRKPNTHGTDEQISLIWYTALDEKTGGYIDTFKNSDFIGMRGETPGLGEFELNIRNVSVNGPNTVISESYLSTIVPNLQNLRETVIAYLRLVTNKEFKTKEIILAGEVHGLPGGEEGMPNFLATQLTVRLPFTMDIVYRSLSGSGGSTPPTGVAYTRVLERKRQEYNNRFETQFGLTAKGYRNDDVQFAQAALSNMIGGIGYFYGASRVQSVHTQEPVPYWKAPLYTSVPSRSFFPRGFLWDEGFHGLLLGAWDVDISVDVMNHWFDLMNVEGWIPREQILGVEALAKVPEEFVTQRNTNANPPTFFLALRKMLHTADTSASTPISSKGRLVTLERLFPRLQAWFTWFNATQRGDATGTYRWRGRDTTSNKELNPKTLTSGLDDYPRASHPTDRERHIDLRCWIAFASGVMADLARVLGRDDVKYVETHSYLSDNYLLNELHLSPYTETFADWGLHTDDVLLRKPTHDGLNKNVPSKKIRVTTKSPEFRYVDSTYGYVSLFPFLLEILTPDSPQLAKTLKDLRDPALLWTKFGLRSLATTAPLYQKYNTEHDPPYWRGAIWININYLALRALYHYGSQPGPFSDDAKQLYGELRANVVGNIIAEYRRTGYLWEQYNDRTGHGAGCKPFTGWTSLVVLMMAEQY